MLKQRVITGVILVAIVLSALFASNPIYWRGLITLVIFIGFWEWQRFCRIKNPALKIMSYAAFGAACYAMQMGYLPLVYVLPVICAVWVFLLVFTISDALNALHAPLFKLVLGIIVLSTSGGLLIELKTIEHGALWIVCFLVAVTFADIGAYFVGRRFGKTKLAPKVSPGKTVEGLFGGLAVVALIFTPILFSLFEVNAAALLLLTVLFTSLVSVGGDLFESKLKRYAGIKDSSQILPGHGGMLDRIDSMLAGAPFFAGGLALLHYLA